MVKRLENLSENKWKKNASNIWIKELNDDSYWSTNRRPFCSLANQNPSILSKRGRNVCHLFELIFYWRHRTAKNMERINLRLFWNLFPKLLKNAILWRLVLGELLVNGIACLILLETQARFQIKALIGFPMTTSDWLSNQHQLETPSQQWQSCQVLD